MNELLIKIIPIITNLFIIYLLSYSFFQLLGVISGIKKHLAYRHQKNLNKRLKKELYIPISIILVIHNDENRIEKIMESLLNLNYNLYEIIIVDNGSEDKTTDIIVGTYDLKKVNRPIRKIIPTKENKSIFETHNQKVKITLIKKENYGVADSYNTGINASEYPYIICINANYHILPNALEYLIEPILESDNVVVSSSNTQIGNAESFELERKYEFPNSTLSKVEAMEYAKENVLRKAENSDLFVFPTLTLLKKEMVQSYLGFDETSFGENFEIIRKLMSAAALETEDFIIKNVYDTTSFYETTKSLKTLIMQRKRWRKAQKRCLKNHRKIKRKNQKIISLYYFFYHKCRKMITFIGIISLGIACISQQLNWTHVFFFILSYIFFNSCLSLFSFLTLLKKEEVKLSPKNFLLAIYGSIMENTILKLF